MELSIVPDDISRSILWFIVYVVSSTCSCRCLADALLDLDVLEECFP